VKTLKPADMQARVFGACSHLHINPVILAAGARGADDLMDALKRDASPDGDICAAVIGGLNFVLINKAGGVHDDYLNDRELLLVIHEAAHLIIGDFDSDEDMGVCQAELLIAQAVHPVLYRALVKMHDGDYSWGSSDYASTKKTKTWAEGKHLAKQRCWRLATFKDRWPMPIQIEALRITEP
jgi:hypothetical protein